MGRAILVAALALGSGCIIESNAEGSAVLYWSFWNTGSHGQLGSEDVTAADICTQMAVNRIVVTLTDPLGYPFTESLPCIGDGAAPGIAYAGMLPGTWQYTVDGLRGGVRLFTWAGSFDVVAGGETVEDSYPTALYWDLELDLDVPSCLEGDAIALDVSDTVYGVVYSTQLASLNPPVTIGCATGGATLIIPSVPGAVTGVSSGSYRVLNLRQLDDLGAVVNYAACIPTWTQPADASEVLAVTVDAGTTPPGGACL